MVIGVSGRGRSILLITCMITDWIGQHDVMLPINQTYDKIGTNKPSIERWTILKRRYEYSKTQHFTQQTAPPQRAQNDVYCSITSTTCATVQLVLKSSCW